MSTIIKNATNNVPLHHGHRPTDTELLLQALVGTWHNLHKTGGGRAVPPSSLWSTPMQWHCSVRSTSCPSVASSHVKYPLPELCFGNLLRQLR